MRRKEKPPDKPDRYLLDQEVAAIFDRFLGESYSDDAYIAYKDVLPAIVEWAIGRTWR